MTERESRRHPASVRELRAAFAVADSNRDGRIDFAEFGQLLRDLEGDMSNQELMVGFREVDTDRDGLIDAREFIEWWQSD